MAPGAMLRGRGVEAANGAVGHGPIGCGHRSIGPGFACSAKASETSGDHQRPPGVSIARGYLQAIGSDHQKAICSLNGIPPIYGGLVSI